MIFLYTAGAPCVPFFLFRFPRIPRTEVARRGDRNANKKPTAQEKARGLERGPLRCALKRMVFLGGFLLSRLTLKRDPDPQDPDPDRTDTDESRRSFHS